MLDGYHKIFNAHAWSQVDRTVDIPQPELGIGAAERLTPTTVKGISYFHSLPQPRTLIPDVNSVDKAAIDGHSQKLTLDMFPSFGYMGEQLGGGF